jgi:EAL domain-containing protein (putative c-di-GMP-specific phosphodiesterase class I)
LQHLPVQTLKIDRAFVSRIGLDADSLEIIRTIVALAHNLGMDVVAEGVETAQQIAQLKALDCEYAQGYYFGKPTDRETAWSLIKTEDRSQKSEVRRTMAGAGVVLASEDRRQRPNGGVILSSDF